MDSRLEHVSFSLLFSTLSQRKVIKLFSSLLMERRVIFCAHSLSLLSGCAHALMALLYPFEWQVSDFDDHYQFCCCFCFFVELRNLTIESVVQFYKVSVNTHHTPSHPHTLTQHVFIPVLPSSLIDFVCSPLPYIIGISPACIKQIDTMETMEEAVIIDLDKKKFIRQVWISLCPHSTTQNLLDCIVSLFIQIYCSIFLFRRLVTKRPSCQASYSSIWNTPSAPQPSVQSTQKNHLLRKQLQVERMTLS